MDRKNKTFIILAVLFLANLLAWQSVFHYRSQSDKLEVTFLDVGQGDAIFIRTPQNHQILIDGGPDSKVLEKVSRELPFWDRDLDMIILTHPEKDHLFGLLEILKSYKVDNIVWSGTDKDTDIDAEWERLKENEISKEGAKETDVAAGQRIVAGKAVFSVLYPFDNSSTSSSDGGNDDSLALRLDLGQNSFLFCGDIGFGEEQKMIDSKSDLAAQVLKVAHHGSKNSTSEKFLQEVKPDLAVIEVGQNSYGHPSGEVLTRLSKSGINTLRTDTNGDIKIVADGNNFSIANR